MGEALIGVAVTVIFVILIALAYSEGKNNMRVGIEAQCVTLGVFITTPTSKKFYCVRDKKNLRKRR